MSGLSQEAWLRRLGYKSKRTATASDWENDKGIPGVAVLAKMLRLSGMDGHYLLTGDGPKERSLATLRIRYGLMEQLLAGKLDHLAEVKGGDVEAPMLQLELTEEPEGSGVGAKNGGG